MWKVKHMWKYHSRVGSPSPHCAASAVLQLAKGWSGGPNAHLSLDCPSEGPRTEPGSSLSSDNPMLAPSMQMKRFPLFCLFETGSLYTVLVVLELTV